MELEEKTDVDGERRGRQLQGRELVGIDGAKEEGKEGGRKGRMRRATFDDLNAIIDINDDIYGGYDYMPTLFYIFMQSKLHVIYVYEEDGRLVALVNFRFHPECDDLITGMAGRVRASYEGRGLGIAPTSLAHVQLLKEHPTIKRFVTDKLYTPILSSKMHKLRLNYHWNFFVYKFPDRQWLSRFTRIRQMAFGVNRAFSLSYTIGTEWLERSDQLIRFLAKYATDLFPCGTCWMPTPVNRSGLRDMLLNTNVYITMDVSTTVENIYSWDPMTSGASVPQGTIDRWKEGDLVGLSYSTGLPCKYGMRIDIFFYGDCEKVFLSHVYSHLLHHNSITSDDARVRVMVHFPLSIDSKNAEELLKEEMGERFHGFSATQSVQYIGDLPLAKL